MTPRGFDSADRLLKRFFADPKRILVLRFTPKDIGTLAQLMDTSYADLARALIMQASKGAKVE